MELRPTWSCSLGGRVDLRPVVHAGRLLLRAAGRLVALDPTTGEERWRTEVDPAGDTGRVLTACDGTIVTSRHVERTTQLIGVGIDGDVRWETPTGTVIVDAHGTVDGRFLAFGSTGSETLLQTFDPASGERLATTPVTWRPDRFVVGGDGRLLAARRGSPGLVSLGWDGDDERDEVAEPVLALDGAPPSLVLCTDRGDARWVELRGDGIDRRWDRPVGAPVVGLAGDVVAAFDAGDDGHVPVLLDTADGAVRCAGKPMADEPRAVTVLDDLVAVQTLTTLRLLWRHDLGLAAEHLLALHAVQTPSGVVVTLMDQVEAYAVG